MTTKNRTHLYYFDHIRALACLGVVYMHTAVRVLNGHMGKGWVAANILTSIAFTAVPLFLMMSGYLLLSNEKTMDVSLLVKRRLPRLVIPLLFWSFMELLCGQLASGVPLGAGMLRNLCSGLVAALSEPVSTPLWYMYTLLAIYVISPILCSALQHLDEKGHRFVLSLILLMNLRHILLLLLPEAGRKYLDIDLFTKLEFFGGHLSTFLFGFYLGKLKRKIPNWLLMTAAGILAAFIIAGTYFLSMDAGEYRASYQNQSHGLEVLLAACIFLLFRQNADKPNAVTHVIAPLSLPMYLMHGTVCNVFTSLGLLANHFWRVLLLTAANYALCFLVTKTLASIKPLCYLTTGMNFEAANRSCNWIYTVRKCKEHLQKPTE